MKLDHFNLNFICNNPCVAVCKHSAFVEDGGHCKMAYCLLLDLLKLQPVGHRLANLCYCDVRLALILHFYHSEALAMYSSSSARIFVSSTQRSSNNKALKERNPLSQPPTKTVTYT